jgi:hypothetical protein
MHELLKELQSNKYILIRIYLFLRIIFDEVKGYRLIEEETFGEVW